MNRSISITFAPASLADFQAAVEWLASQAPPVTSATVTVRPPVAKGEAPSVAEYLALTGEKHFKRTREECDAGLTPEQAARLRLDAMGNEAPSVETSDEFPPHDGTPLF